MNPAVQPPHQRGQRLPFGPPTPGDSPDTKAPHEMTALAQQFTPSATHLTCTGDSAPTAGDRAELAHLDDTEFECLVVANAFRGSRDPATWAALTSTELIERTHTALFNASERNAAAIAR